MSLLDLAQLRADRAAWLGAHDDPPTVELTEEELDTIRYRLLAQHLPNLLAAHQSLVVELESCRSELVSCRSGRDTERAERLAEQERIRALADDLFRMAWRASHEPAYSRLASETGAKLRAVLDKP